MTCRTSSSSSSTERKLGFASFSDQGLGRVAQYCSRKRGEKSSICNSRFNKNDIIVINRSTCSLPTCRTNNWLFKLKCTDTKILNFINENLKGFNIIKFATYLRYKLVEIASCSCCSMSVLRSNVVHLFSLTSMS